MKNAIQVHCPVRGEASPTGEESPVLLMVGKVHEVKNPPQEQGEEGQFGEKGRCAGALVKKHSSPPQ